MQWQLLIVVTFLFASALAFFAVLFNDATSGISTSVTIQENENENVKYRHSVTSSFDRKCENDYVVYGFIRTCYLFLYSYLCHT
jgi:hypothetical protein